MYSISTCTFLHFAILQLFSALLTKLKYTSIMQDFWLKNVSLNISLEKLNVIDSELQKIFMIKLNFDIRKFEVNDGIGVYQSI